MRLIVLLMAVFLAACGDDEAKPPAPVDPTREAVTHFGRMILLDHDGPKGQAIVRGMEKPVWFSSARDLVAFTMLPEETKDIRALYVTDMAKSESWDDPEVWMPAKQAHYVIGSVKRGGMGALEAVPFSDRVEAERFTRKHGGDVVAWDAIPRDYIFEESVTPEAMMDHGDMK